MKRGVGKICADGEISIGFRPHSPVEHHRPMTASLIGHHKMVNGNGAAKLPESPTSLCSSLEIAVHDRATPCHSIMDITGKPQKHGSNLKTSAELLNVLNRIWILEEQHSSNVSKIKALKLERDHALARVEDSILEQQEDLKQMDELMKQFAEDKLITKSRVHERIKASVQSVREELKDERKLRRRSESLHRKLARDLAELKMSLSESVKELGRERNTRLLLEDLCDELAKGVVDYEQELQGFRQKYEKESSNGQDRFIVHIAEAWLDERVQMKLAVEDHDSADKNTGNGGSQHQIGNLRREKRSCDGKSDRHSGGVHNDDRLRRFSVESVLLNEAASGSQSALCKNSLISESDGFIRRRRSVQDPQEVVKKHILRNKVIADLETAMQLNHPQQEVLSQERGKGRISCSSVEQLGDKASCSKSGNRDHCADNNVVEEGIGDSSNHIRISVCHKSGNCDQRQGYHRSGKHKQTQKAHHVNQFTSLSNGGMFRSGNYKHKEDDYSPMMGHNSVGSRNQFLGGAHDTERPTKKWAFHGSSPDLDLSESSSKTPCPSKENTLKAKLLEARLEEQQARLRLAREVHEIQ